MDRPAAVAVRHQLLECRQNDRAAGLLQRVGKRLIGSRVRRRAEIDVEHDVARAGARPACRSAPHVSRRGQGQTPTFSIEGESIATRTMSPLAWRGNQPNRISVRAFCNALCVPVSRTMARTHDTRICGRYRFTPPPPQPPCTGFQNSGARRGGRISRRSRQLLADVFLLFRRRCTPTTTATGQADGDGKADRESNVLLGAPLAGALAHRTEIGGPCCRRHVAARTPIGPSGAVAATATLIGLAEPAPEPPRRRRRAGHRQAAVTRAAARRALLDRAQGAGAVQQQAAGPCAETCAAWPGCTSAYLPDLNSITSTWPLTTSTRESSLFDGDAELGALHHGGEIRRLDREMLDVPLLDLEQDRAGLLNDRRRQIRFLLCRDANARVWRDQDGLFAAHQKDPAGLAGADHCRPA